MSLKPVSGKIESQELNDNFSYLESLIKVGGGMSFNAIESLTELENVYPNGSDKVFVTADTGFWYFWNGSAWTLGGSFIAPEWMDVLTEQDEEWII